ncbi:MAG: exonuclease domain-containing protein, partial [Lachnospiraceae bacterium]|nr:exonuclease domain-containing protein [Lachnospiraceae bacterium]
MNYIVFDLEWNQSDTGSEPEAKEIPFEIIDIGAIKLNGERVMTEEYNQLIKPSVYHHMHKVTGNLIHLHMRDLKKGRPFEEVIKEFLSFCGTDFIFCTWGPLDVFELQRNMHYYKMTPLSDTPI